MDGELVYLDTSGVLAFLNLDDACHQAARVAWEAALVRGQKLVMTDYARLEAWSLIQNRLGLEAVVDFRNRILPICRIEAVGEQGFEILSRQVLLGRSFQFRLHGAVGHWLRDRFRQALCGARLPATGEWRVSRCPYCLGG